MAATGKRTPSIPLVDAAYRLAAYEDTGLEPEDIKKVFNEDAVLKLAAQCLGTTPDRLRELAQAEQDGRLAMLPCKVGDVVYDIQDGTPYPTRVLSFSFFGYWACRTVSSYPDLELFGKRIFLTREEAEAALEAQRGAEHEGKRH